MVCGRLDAFRPGTPSVFRAVARAARALLVSLTRTVRCRRRPVRPTRLSGWGSGGYPP